MFDLFRPWKGLRIPVILITSALLLGTLGFKIFFPEESFLRLLYMTGITLTTVGYSDILGVEKNPAAILYTLFMMITGMGVVLYSTSLFTAYIVEGNLKDAFTRERLRRRIRKMENHFIICGAGETGYHVINEMMASGVNCVVIELSEEKRDELRESFPHLAVITGDATLDHILEEAGISKARGLVATLSNDKDNLFLTVSAKMLHADLTIVARAVELAMIKKLEKAGASKVVSPNYIGGVQMASEILRPNLTNFVEMVLSSEKKTVRVEEIKLPKSSSINGVSLGKAQLFDQCGVNILGIGRKNEEQGEIEYLYTPGPDFTLKENDILLYMADQKQEEKLLALVSGS